MLPSPSADPSECPGALLVTGDLLRESVASSIEFDENSPSVPRRFAGSGAAVASGSVAWDRRGRWGETPPTSAAGSQQSIDFVYDDPPSERRCPSGSTIMSQMSPERGSATRNGSSSMPPLVHAPIYPPHRSPPHIVSKSARASAGDLTGGEGAFLRPQGGASSLSQPPHRVPHRHAEVGSFSIPIPRHYSPQRPPAAATLKAAEDTVAATNATGSGQASLPAPPHLAPPTKSCASLHAEELGHVANSRDRPLKEGGSNVSPEARGSAELSDELTPTRSASALTVKIAVIPPHGTPTDEVERGSMEPRRPSVNQENDLDSSPRCETLREAVAVRDVAGGKGDLGTDGSPTASQERRGSTSPRGGREDVTARLIFRDRSTSASDQEASPSETRAGLEARDGEASAVEDSLHPALSAGGDAAERPDLLDMPQERPVQQHMEISGQRTRTSGRSSRRTSGAITSEREPRAPNGTHLRGNEARTRGPRAGSAAATTAPRSRSQESSGSSPAPLWAREHKQGSGKSSVRSAVAEGPLSAGKGTPLGWQRVSRSRQSSLGRRGRSLCSHSSDTGRSGSRGRLGKDAALVDTSSGGSSIRHRYVRHQSNRSRVSQSLASHFDFVEDLHIRSSRGSSRSAQRQLDDRHRHRGSGGTASHSRSGCGGRRSPSATTHGSTNRDFTLTQLSDRPTPELRMRRPAASHSAECYRGGTIPYPQSRPRDLVTSRHTSEERRTDARSSPRRVLCPREEELLSVIDDEISSIEQVLYDREETIRRSMSRTPWDRLFHESNRRERDEKRELLRRLDELSMHRLKLLYGDKEEELRRTELARHAAERARNGTPTIFERLYALAPPSAKRRLDTSSNGTAKNPRTRCSSGEKRTAKSGTSRSRTESQDSSGVREMSPHERLYQTALALRAAKQQRAADAKLQREEDLKRQMYLSKIEASIELSEPGRLLLPSEVKSRLVEAANTWATSGMKPPPERKLTPAQVESVNRRLARKYPLRSTSAAQQYKDLELKECTFHPQTNNNYPVYRRLHRSSSPRSPGGNARSDGASDAGSSKHHRKRSVGTYLYRQRVRERRKKDDLKNRVDRDRRLAILKAKLHEDHHFRRRVELDPSLAERFMASLVV